MSDENLNNNNEETAALFVSAQKKKKAEEEARKKAEEEKARREAAEAEVRRMEEEVEERKRKAEEEKKALEEAEAAAKEKPPVIPVKEIKEKASEVTAKAGEGGSSKTPLFIGIGAAVVVVILIAVFALKGKGGSGSGAAAASVEEMEFNAEYMSKEKGYDFKIAYPEGLFDEVADEFEDGNLFVTMKNESDKKPDIYMNVSQLTNNGMNLTVGMLGFLSAKDIQDGLTGAAKSYLENMLEGDMNITDESSVDVADSEPVMYGYACTFESEEHGSGACTSWYEANSDGEYKGIIMISVRPDGDKEYASKLLDEFVLNNMHDPLMVPGGSPIESKSLDGMLEINELHMGIPVPDNRFIKYPGMNENDGKVMWTDKNGASIWVDYAELDFPGSELEENREVYMESIKQTSLDYGVDKVMNSVNDGLVESREFIGDRVYDASEMVFGYYADFDDVIGGVPYRERRYTQYWLDLKTEKEYLVSICTLAPISSKDGYQELFDNLLSNLKDL